MCEFASQMHDSFDRNARAIRESPLHSLFLFTEEFGEEAAAALGLEDLVEIGILKALFPDDLGLLGAGGGEIVELLHCHLIAQGDVLAALVGAG